MAENDIWDFKVNAKFLREKRISPAAFKESVACSGLVGLHETFLPPVSAILHLNNVERSAVQLPVTLQRTSPENIGKARLVFDRRKLAYARGVATPQTIAFLSNPAQGAVLMDETVFPLDIDFINAIANGTFPQDLVYDPDGLTQAWLSTGVVALANAADKGVAHRDIGPTTVAFQKRLRGDFRAVITNLNENSWMLMSRLYKATERDAQRKPDIKEGLRLFEAEAIKDLASFVSGFMLDNKYPIRDRNAMAQRSIEAYVALRERLFPAVISRDELMTEWQDAYQSKVLDHMARIRRLNRA